MNKKAIAILGVIFVLIVGTLGFLVFQKYTAKTPAAPVATTTPNGTDQNPDPEPIPEPIATTTPDDTATIVKLSDTQVVSPVLFYNGSGITYFTTTGQLFQADLTSFNPLQLTNVVNLNIKQKNPIGKILWPAAGDNFMAQATGINGLPNWSFFNSKIGDYIDLPSQVTSLDWMPDGQKIIYIWLDNGKATLNIADPDTKNYTELGSMWETDDAISIAPDGNSILYYETASASSTNPIYYVTSDGKIWKTPINTGYNYGVLWSPDSQKFLFGKRDITSGNYQLWYYNLMTAEFKNLGLTTIPNKAVWGSDSTTIYAAVPNIGSTSSGLTQDSFVRVNTATLAQKSYSNFSQQVDGQNLFLSLDGTKLFFKNAQDGLLYYLDVSQQ